MKDELGWLGGMELLEGGKHKWVCTSPGMYDSLYKCSKCNKEHMESSDDIDSYLPLGGCKV